MPFGSHPCLATGGKLHESARGPGEEKGRPFGKRMARGDQTGFEMAERLRLDADL